MIGINARDLATFAIDRRAQLELVAATRPTTAVVVAESGIHTRAQGAAAELAGADAILVGSALMQAPDPAAKLRELLRAAAREGLRADAGGGRRRRGRGGRRPRRLHPRAPRARGAAPRVLPVPDDDARRRGLGRRGGRDGGRPRPAATSARERPPQPRRRPPAGRASRSRRCSTCPGSRTIPSTSSGRPPPRAASCSPAASRPTTSRAAIEARAAVGRRRELAARARAGHQGSRSRCAPTSRRRRVVTATYGAYGGRYVPETLIPALDELTAAWREAQRGRGLPRRARRSSAARTPAGRRRSRSPSGSRPASGSTSSARTCSTRARTS